MVICIIALVVFTITGLFSASHRAYAKEAFNCVFRRMTLRKCDTGFDKKMKMKISTKIMKRSPKAGRFVYRHFDAISVIFTIIMFASLAYSAYSIYNLVTLGTCDPQNPDACVFSAEPTAEPICSCNFDTSDCGAEDYGKCGTDCKCLKETCAIGQK